MIEEVTGDMLNAVEQYVCHQTNCVAGSKPKGLSEAMFGRYPHADSYTGRKHPQLPGSISVHGGTEAGQPRGVINCYGQFTPGPPFTSQVEIIEARKGKWGSQLRAMPDVEDDARQRLEWFGMLLDEIADLPQLEEVVFPHMFGCGLAGGDWPTYYA